jgi:hypothetical protein
MLRWLPWPLLIVFMTKDGEQQNARHLAGYYVFFFPTLLAATGHRALVRKIWWQRAAIICMVMAAGILVVNTNRPLFPAVTIFEKLAARHPQSHIFALLQRAYNEPYSLGQLKQQLAGKLPADGQMIGYAATGNAETEPVLWMPFGCRRVERVLQQDNPEQLATNGIHWVVIHDIPSRSCTNIDDWMGRYHATLEASVPIQTEMSQKRLVHVYVMRLNQMP